MKNAAKDFNLVKIKDKKMTDKSIYIREKYLIKNCIHPYVYDVLKDNNAYIAGGVLTSIFSRSKVNDIDIYFKDKLGMEAVKKFFSNNSYKLEMETAKALSYSHRGIFYQLIIHPGLIKENTFDLFELYDFTICMAAYDMAEDKIIVHDQFFQHLAQRRLVFNHKTKYPICSLMRIKKYIARGFSINYTELIKIALTVHQLELENLSVLKDQLEGIDTLFMKPLIESLENKGELKYDFKEFIDLIDHQLELLYGEEENI